MSQTRSQIPEEIYVGFVRSLFKDAHILILGAACQGVMALLVYRSSGEPVYLALGLGLVLSGMLRYATALWAKRGEVVTDKTSAKQWERVFLAGTLVQSLAAGAFSFTAIYLVPDQFGEVAAVAVFLSAGMTIVGRNYGSRTIVLILSIGVILPIGAGWMMRGDLNYFVLGLMMVPFLVIAVQMAKTVRTVLFAAITEEKKATYLARRFDWALNTMAHGLIMLSNEGRVVVANAEAARLLGYATSSQMLGRSLRALFRRAVASGVIDAADSQDIEMQLSSGLSQTGDRKLLVPLSDQRYFEFTARPGTNDLGVITFEEVTQRVKSEERIRYMARYDSLTGLPNRAYFNEMLVDMVAKGDAQRLCGLVIFDLDDFKSINDTLGHAVGDGLIVAVAQKLAELAPEGVVVGRFGGDEFTMYFDEVERPVDFTNTMERIFGEMTGNFDIAGNSIRVQLSAGGVLGRAGCFDVEAMMVKADLALYNAKERGKNGWRLFEGAMDEAFRNRQTLKADLRAAIETGSLRAAFQPIISMQTMRMESCEALCRWDHPEFGPISPAVFIPLAEEMGVVGEISSFILDKACAECAKWPDHIGISVNLSAKDFKDSSIVGKIADILDRHGLRPDRLEVEVTETAVLDDKSSTIQVIGDLKALGVRIALDDFGTGYSSLGYLQILPLDKIKVDRTFIDDIASNQRSLDLLKGIVGLSRTLGLAVTIEGVESFEQLKVLNAEVKPDYAQGFLFGASLSASGIETMSSVVWPFTREPRAIHSL
ncbi:MAG: putative bifunctional diguanylate cyclase/phosphodiesterase [Aliihoeflea sp.]